jgi:pimeloyl-ACP methyl ester carboxylesterase
VQDGSDGLRERGLNVAAMMGGVCRANGVELHYLRTGGAKPALVLLHGLTASGACWSPVARGLAEQFDVVMPDARGHGASSAPLYGYRYEDHASDAIALIEQIGVVNPIVIGHSMGGMTAAVVARRRARDIRGVILVDPTFISPQWQREVRDSDVADNHRRMLGLDKAAVLADLQARHPRRSLEILERLAEARLQTRMSAFDVLTPPNPDYRQLVRDIDVPIMLVISDGGVVSRDAAREIASLNPRVRVELIEGAGHGIPYDQPERLEALVRDSL